MGNGRLSIKKTLLRRNFCIQKSEARREELKPEELAKDKEEVNKTIFELWHASSWSEKPKCRDDIYEERLPEKTHTRLGRPIRPIVQTDMIYYK